MLSENWPEHALDIRDQGIEVERIRAYGFPSSEAQQLRRQSRAPLGGLANLVDRLTARVLIAGAVQQKVAVARDDGQQIGEIMRHAAHHASDRFEFRRLRGGFRRRHVDFFNNQRASGSLRDDDAARRSRRAGLLGETPFGAGQNRLESVEQGLGEERRSFV